MSTTLDPFHELDRLGGTPVALLLTMTSHFWSTGLCACVFLLGCSSTTTLTLRDGTMVEGMLAPRTDDASVRVTEERGSRDILVAEVVAVSHPGSNRMGVGGALAFLGLVGHLTLSVIAFEEVEPYVDSSGFAYDDNEGCELCVLGLPGSITPLTFGTGLIFHGLALRMESQNQWRNHGDAVGSAHLRLGRGALATGLLLSALPAVAGTGFALIGLAPGFVLTGIALLIRGTRLRRGQRPAVELTRNGFAFDLSL